MDPRNRLGNSNSWGVTVAFSDSSGFRMVYLEPKCFPTILSLDGFSLTSRAIVKKSLFIANT